MDTTILHGVAREAGCVSLPKLVEAKRPGSGVGNALWSRFFDEPTHLLTATQRRNDQIVFDRIVRTDAVSITFLFLEESAGADAGLSTSEAQLERIAALGGVAAALGEVAGNKWVTPCTNGLTWKVQQMSCVSGPSTRAAATSSL
jgi:hypothetical protein